MKKLLLSIITACTLVSARADEGMWIPMLIGKNYAEMSRMGLKLSKEDIYNINKSSLKDAIVQFGGGCTAEMISEDGLLLTNHHCGYDAIATLSSVDHNYLDNGYWANMRRNELPAKGLSVIFLQRVEDVTDEVNAAVGDAKGKEWEDRVDKISRDIEHRESLNDVYVAHVRSFFAGNQFLLLIYKKYNDVRFVGAPPKSLGKFGGDTDNWMWPRHTADFSMFRVYAGKNNQPAEYAEDNVPYKPKKHLPVSIKGQKEGDFAMIMGYPGRTNRYEVSYGVNLSVNETNPAIVKARDLRLSIMRRHMAKDKALYLRLTSQYARIANYWKYYIGQTEQLKRLNIVAEKKQQEEEFTKWAVANKQDADLMGEYEAAYSDIAPYAKHMIYYNEGFKASILARLAGELHPLYKLLAKKVHNTDSITYYVQHIKDARAALMKDYDLGIEKEMMAEMTKLFYDNVDKSQLPDIYEKVIKKYGSLDAAKTYTAYTDYVFKNTFLLDSNQFNALLEAPTHDKIRKDPAVQYAFSFLENYTDNYWPKIEAYVLKKADLNRRYQHDLMLWKKDKQFYPDANSTMRVTYGKVLSYEPKDGVHYNYFTTIDGLMAKYKPGSDEFDVPQDLIDLYNAKDYGRYADKDGTIHTCFITNNDITGGNSGSPVINGKGELIGCAFDGNWEAMSGDIAFDKNYKRTIICDIRYILFLIDKMGKANNLIAEMDIRD